MRAAGCLVALWSILGLALPTMLFGQAAATSAEPESTVLEVQLRLDRGLLAVDRTATRLVPSSAFSAAALSSQAALTEQLADDLDLLLKDRGAAYLLAVPNCERPAVVDAKTRAAAGDVAELTAAWPQAVDAFDVWASQTPDCASSLDASRLTLPRVLAERPIWGRLSQQTALIDPSPSEFDNPLDAFAFRPDYANGRYRFLVQAPLAASEPKLTVLDGDTVLGEAILRSALEPFVGNLWRPPALRCHLNQLFAPTGLEPRFEISSAGQPPTIGVLESPRIDRLVLPSGDPRTVAEIVYIVFGHQHKKLVLTPIAGLDGYGSLDLATLLGGDHQELPLLDRFRIEAQTRELAAIGMSLTSTTSASSGTTPDGAADRVSLLVRPIEKAEAAAKPAEATDPLASPGRSVAADSLTSELSGLPVHGGDRNFVGLGVEYRPDQGTRATVEYRRRGVLGKRDQLRIVLGSFDEVLGTLDYHRDYVALPRLGRRLSVELGIGQDSVNERQLGGREVDQRQRRGSAKASLELLRRPLTGERLAMSAAFGRSEVELETPDEGTLLFEQDLWWLDSALEWSLDRRQSASPWWWRSQAHLRLGLALGDQAPSFQRLQLRGRWHRQISRHLQADVRIHAAGSAGDVPVFELPTLGGAESLRGLRADAAVGDITWSVQNGLWAPVIPACGGCQNRFVDLLRKYLMVAAVLDIGGVEDSAAGSVDGLRVGAGVGLRLNLQQPVVLALDWAEIVDSPLPEERRGRAYFSLLTTIDLD